MRGFSLLGSVTLRSSPGLGMALLDEPACEHAIHGGAEVVDIGLLVDHLLDGLFRGHELRSSLDAVLGLAAEPGGAKVDQLHLTVLRQHDVVRLQVAVKDAASVHVRERRGHLAEDQDKLAKLGRLDLVEALAVDVFHQELGAGDLEPRLALAIIIDLGDRRMVELLRGLELGLGLLDEDVVLGLLLANDLEGIALAPGVLSLIRKILLPAPSPSSLTTRYFIPDNLGVLETFAIRCLIH